jgi:hypothetical protein
MPAVLMSGDLEAPFLREEPPEGVIVLRKPVDGATLLAAASRASALGRAARVADPRSID